MDPAPEQAAGAYIARRTTLTAKLIFYDVEYGKSDLLGRHPGEASFDAIGRVAKGRAAGSWHPEESVAERSTLPPRPATLIADSMLAWMLSRPD